MIAYKYATLRLCISSLEQKKKKVKHTATPLNQGRMHHINMDRERARGGREGEREGERQTERERQRERERESKGERERAFINIIIIIRQSHSIDYIYKFCLLPDPDVGPSIIVCDVEHTSFHFGLCGRKFVLCLFGQCPGLCTICHSWQHTGVVHLSLQADGRVAFEDIPVFGVCRPSCHDSSLDPFVLVLFLEAVVLSQVHVILDIFYQHIVTFIGVLSRTITFVFAMFILRHIRLRSSDSSCSIYCSSCGVYVHRNMSPAKRSLEINSPSIFTPLFSQFNLLNMLSNVAVNSSGEMVSRVLLLY